jgi:hypothetical protein
MNANRPPLGDFPLNPEDYGVEVPPSRPRDPKRAKGGRQTINKDELDKRISFVAFLLSQMRPKGEVKQAIMKMWQCSARTCETYFSRARSRLSEWSGMTKDAARSRLLEWAWGQMQADIKLWEKLGVFREIKEIMGLAAPLETVVKGDKDNPITITVDDINRARAKAKEWRNERLASANGTADAPSEN